MKKVNLKFFQQLLRYKLISRLAYYLNFINERSKTADSNQPPKRSLCMYVVVVVGGGGGSWHVLQSASLVLFMVLFCLVQIAEEEKLEVDTKFRALVAIGSLVCSVCLPLTCVTVGMF